jgi:hypothetical protein
MHGSIFLWLKAAAALLVAGSAAAAGGTVVRDPHYGDGLFHFYQDHYFTALGGLMVSQHFGRMPRHVEDAEVLRGGLLLSFGLHREAERIFTRLLDGNATAATADRAWFYLAKLRYQRGLQAEAEQAIGRVGGSLPPVLQEERLLLHAQLLMARAEYAGAAQLLAAATSPASRYVRYNLGVALVRSGETARAVALLDQLGRAPAADEEGRGLRDRANVAAGFTALQAGQPQQARGYFERVRLAGMHANQALLGFGWAAAELKQPRLALVPWEELAGRDADDAAVLEAKLALPYAFGELGAYRQSLNLYQQAIDVFERESGRLDESVASIRAGRLVDGLLAADGGEQMGWLRAIDRLPALPHVGHLSPVLADHAFQEGFKSLHDLLLLERRLRQWKDDLDALRDMLENRRAAFAERLPKVRDREGGIDLDRTAASAAMLAAEIARIETEGDAEALADARHRALAARLARVLAAIERLDDDGLAGELRERARRVAGLLAWQQNEQFAPRLWRVKKAMREIDRLLPQARARAQALARASREAPADFEAFAQRLAALNARIDQALPRTAELAREQRQVVENMAAAVLLRQKQRLAEYAAQARFAVARLYDRAHLAVEQGHDARP